MRDIDWDYVPNDCDWVVQEHGSLYCDLPYYIFAIFYKKILQKVWRASDKKNFPGKSAMKGTWSSCPALWYTLPTEVFDRRQGLVY